MGKPITGAVERAATPAKPVPVRVLLVDDVPRVRIELGLLLQLAAEIEIVGEAENGSEAIALAAALHPDVVVTDLEMPVMDGCEAARQILQRGLAGKVVLLSIHSGAELRQRASAAGVTDFIHKGEAIERLFEAILRP